MVPVSWHVHVRWHNCRLHPLIHTLLDFTLVQNVEKKKAEPGTPHFLSLSQDIVAGSQEEKCGLKYVMHTPLYRKGVLNQQKWVVGIKKPPIV